LLFVAAVAGTAGFASTIRIAAGSFLTTTATSFGWGLRTLSFDKTGNGSVGDEAESNESKNNDKIFYHEFING